MYRNVNLYDYFIGVYKFILLRHGTIKVDFPIVFVIKAINSAASVWGVQCLRYEIKDIQLPPTIKQTLEKQVIYPFCIILLIYSVRTYQQKVRKYYV